MNRNRDRGIRAENEACRLLESLFGYPYGTIVRRKNEGIAEDIGDLWGVPDTCIQVSAVRRTDSVIADRARMKTATCQLQQMRRAYTHGVVLLRIDGRDWRAVCNTHQINALGIPTVDLLPRTTSQGAAIVLADEHPGKWLTMTDNRFAATVNTWADNWLHAMYPRTFA